MDITIQSGNVQGSVQVPSSKSQTIRALLLAAFAEGTSLIHNPLKSQDTLSCLHACEHFGAVIEDIPTGWKVTSLFSREPASQKQRKTSPLLVDTGNSGTTLYLGCGMAAALGIPVVFTGDEQIRSRPVQALLSSLTDLGAVISTGSDELAAAFPGLSDQEILYPGKPGCPPFIVEGPLTGGKTTISCPTSQYLSSLLLASPLAEGDTHITIPLLHERPYVEMTMRWLREQNITFNYTPDLSEFTIKGGQSYSPFETSIAGDFSSASFFFCAAAITGSKLTVTGLDPNDTQGDKDILYCLEKMGCSVDWHQNAVTIQGPPKGKLQGATLNLNPIPDTLPILAVTACFAAGVTRLVNVPQARIKETDRIAVMCEELTKLGAHIKELPDGLIIENTQLASNGITFTDIPGALTGGNVCGHNDHRVIMSLAIAALAAEGPITIIGADAVTITFPSFFELLASIQTTV